MATGDPEHHVRVGLRVGDRSIDEGQGEHAHRVARALVGREEHDVGLSQRHGPSGHRARRRCGEHAMHSARFLHREQRVGLHAAHNLAARRPRNALRLRRQRGEADRSAARHGNLEELAVHRERDPTTIRGERRIPRVGASRKGRHRQLIELAHVELTFRAGVGSPHHQREAIGGERQQRVLQLPAFLAIDGEARHHVGGRCPVLTASRQHPGGDGGKRDRARQQSRRGTRSDTARRRHHRAAGVRPAGRGQCTRKLGRTRLSIGRKFRQRREHGLLHVTRNGIAHARWRLGLARQHARHNRLHTRARERRCAGEHLVRYRAEGVDVTACIDGAFTHRLLRAHVLRRAET